MPLPIHNVPAQMYGPPAGAPATAPAGAATPQLQRIAERSDDFEVQRFEKVDPDQAPNDGVDKKAPRRNGPAGAEEYTYDFGDGDKQAVKVSPPPAEKAKESDKTVASEMSSDARKALGQLNKLTTPELQKMIREGRLPEDVASDPVAMMVINERLQAFNRMINMITNMMQAEHEALMAIIRNIRA